MKHPMQQLSLYVNAYTHTGSDRHIDNAAFPFCLTEGDLSKNRTVNVCVKAYRAAKRFFKSPYDIVICPCQLRRAGDISIGSRTSVRINRTKTANSKCLHSCLLKIIDHFRNRFLRCPCGDGNLLVNLSRLIPNGTHHFCSTRFQCSQFHSILLLDLLYECFCSTSSTIIGSSGLAFSAASASASVGSFCAVSRHARKATIR